MGTPRPVLRWLAWGLGLAAALMVSPARAQAPANAVDLELVLAVDVSGSIDEEEAALQRGGLVEAFRSEHVVRVIQRGRLKRIAVTVVEWGGNRSRRLVVDWTVVSDMASAGTVADALDNAPLATAMFTSISGVIDYAGERLALSPYASRRRVIDISGDGPNNQGELVVPARDRMLAKGVTINGLPIINGRPSRYGMPAMPDLDLYYEDCVIGGPGAFIVVANGFEDFARAIRRKMIMEIAGAVPSPAPRLQLAQARPRPPCDAGEQRMRDMREDL